MMGGGESSYGGGGGKSVSALQYELKKAYETLEGMEYDRDMHHKSYHKLLKQKLRTTRTSVIDYVSCKVLCLYIVSFFA